MGIFVSEDGKDLSGNSHNRLTVFDGCMEFLCAEYPRLSVVLFYEILSNFGIKDVDNSKDIRKVLAARSVLRLLFLALFHYSVSTSLILAASVYFDMVCWHFVLE